MNVGQILIEGARRVFVLSDDQKFALGMAAIFLVMLALSLFLSFALHIFLETHGITWRKVIRPAAYVALVLIAILEAFLDVMQNQKFIQSLKCKLSEVNQLAFGDKQA